MEELGDGRLLYQMPQFPLAAVRRDRSPLQVSEVWRQPGPGQSECRVWPCSIYTKVRLVAEDSVVVGSLPSRPLRRPCIVSKLELTRQVGHVYVCVCVCVYKYKHMDLPVILPALAYAQTKQNPIPSTCMYMVGAGRYLEPREMPSNPRNTRCSGKVPAVWQANPTTRRGETNAPSLAESVTPSYCSHQSRISAGGVAIDKRAMARKEQYADELRRCHSLEKL